MIDWLLRPREQALAVDIGGRLVPLVLRRNAQARRMTMRLAPDGREIRVTLPQWGRSAEGLAFARSKAAWLAAQIDALPPDMVPGHGKIVLYRGEELTISHNPTAPRRVTVAEGALHVGGPAESLPSRLTRWLQGEARRLLVADLDHYCLKAGKPVPGLMLSSAQRRWGSCARDGTIRINWRLVMAPDFVRRSVVAHEVAHLIYFDHSTSFHTLLGNLFEGDLRAANRWLKRDGRSLYLPLG
ncbi:YgjP-like metallopeptidase domain-containing protein [Novosphingobium sp.]|uniref:M48 family metallopeptidase n=1 Tax=Novosphingobium sp. TaxID=1874826 RepID=UPI0025FE172B|nr:YgjP-like metallopeptidase domain-containing protein [Novosphingobium sp.]